MNINNTIHFSKQMLIYVALACLPALILVPAAMAASGEVFAHQKISATEGGFTGTLVDLDQFGHSVASLGDLDGDGVDDLAVGARDDDDGGVDSGAVWVLFLNSDGTVKAQQKISSTEGGFTGILDDSDDFGCSVAALGDLDGDFVPDLAVGAIGDDDGGPARGAVWVVFLNSDGTVKAHQKISDTAGGFTGVLNTADGFSNSVASLGDLDGDSVPDLAVGAYSEHPDWIYYGAVWILFLNSDGTVKAHQKINTTEGGFTGTLVGGERFGASVASLGDLDDDGVADLGVGAIYDGDGGTARGAVWVLFLNSDGTVKTHQKISSTTGGFTGVLHNNSYFGYSVATPGDLDGDGVTDLAVGAVNDPDGGQYHGAVWVLFLNSDGTVKSHQKISDTAGGFTGVLDNNDFFGCSVASLGDLDGDGITDLAVGAYGDDDGGSKWWNGRGAVWVLFLDGVGQGTVAAELTCLPASGTVPFTAQISVTMENLYPDQIRRIAARIDLDLANGLHYSNWKAGSTNIAAGDFFQATYQETIPGQGKFIGDNIFTLTAEDATPSPYNQPPYPPAGDTATAVCTVTGIAP